MDGADFRGRKCTTEPEPMNPLPGNSANHSLLQNYITIIGQKDF